MASVDETSQKEKGLDEMSEADAFKEVYALIAGHWPEDREERDRIFWSSPGIMICVLAGAYQLGGNLTTEEANDLSNMFGGLLRILLRAHAGEEKAQQQLLAVKKLIFPITYKVPPKVINNLAKKYNTHGPLARGWEIRYLMTQLSTFVVPASSKQRDVTKGPVRLADDPSMKQRDLYREALSKCHKNTTLQSLAINIYLDRLEQKGDFSTDIRSLKRDLEKVRAWEEDDELHMEAKYLLSLSEQKLMPFVFPTVSLSERNLPLPAKKPAKSSK